MKKDKFSKAFKTYNIIMQEVWKFLTIILIGVLIGYLIYRKTHNNIGFVISIIVALVLALIEFFVSLIRISKKGEKNNDEVSSNQEPKQ